MARFSEAEKRRAFERSYTATRPRRRRRRPRRLKNGAARHFSEVAGPYRDESSVPSVRKKARPSEHRKVRSRKPKSSEAKSHRAKREKRTKQERREAAARAALETPELGSRKQRQRTRKQRREARRIAASLGRPKPTKQRAPKVPTLTQRDTSNREGYSPTKAEALSQPVLGDLEKLKDEGKIGKTTGQEIYEKIAEYGPSALTLGPEIKVASTALKAALGGVEAGGVRVGGSRIARRIAKPARARTPSQQAAASRRVAERAAVKQGSGVRAAAKRAGRRVTRAEGRADARLARQVAGTPTRRQAAAAAGVPLKALKAGSIQAIPAVRGHEQALTENPGQTIKTTARAIPGLVTVPVGQAAGVAVAGGRAASAGLHEAGVPGFRGYSGKEIVAPVVELGKEQLAFAKQIAQVITADDPAEVQKAVEDELGLLLPIMLGLGTKAAVSKISKGKITEAVRSIREEVWRRTGREHGRHNGEAPRIFEVAGQRKAEARRAARHRTRSERERRDRTEPILRAAKRSKGSEIVRRGVGPRRGVRGRPADLEVRTRDLVGFAARHGLPLDKPAEALAEVKRIGAGLKPLPDGVSLPKDRVHTRDLIAYIERNPDVLADPNLRDAVDLYRAQARSARETPGLSPEHSERARYTPAAVTRRIPLTQHRFPQSVRDITRAEPTYGVEAKDVLRAEAREDAQRARRVGRKGDAARRRAKAMGRESAILASQVEPRMASAVARRERIKRLEARRRSLAEKRQALRDQGSSSKLMQQYGRAQQKINREIERLGVEPTTATKQRRVQLRRNAEGEAAVARKQRQIAATSREAAKVKRRAAYEIDPAVAEEFVGEMRQRLREEGMPDPEYVYTGRGRETPTYGATGAKLTNFPGRSKRKRGGAEEYGMVREDLPHTLRESIARPISRRESYAAMRGFLRDNEYVATSSSRPDSGSAKSEFTSDQARELFESGEIPRDRYVLIPRQLYARAFDRFDPQQAAAGLRLALDGDDLPGRKFKIVRRVAAEEFFSQLTASFSPVVARINQFTSSLILKTSPAWAASQIVAEYAQAAVAQPKILSPRFVRRAIREYKRMPSHERQAFDSWVGVTTRSLESPDDMRLELGTGDMKAADDAMRALDRTPLGKAITAIPKGIGKLDEVKGGRIRMLTVAAKLDRDLNGRTVRFLRGIRGLHDEIAKASAEMAGRPLSEQMGYMANHPELAHRYTNYLDDVMGNWAALTKRERVASGLVIFYPFMRMATRWTFYAFPKRHPIKAALMLYLGQQNATELKKLLGQDPSFWTGWATVPLHLGDGETQLIPLSRIAPGLGPAVEVIGEGADGGDLGAVSQQTLRGVQPAIAAAITAATGVDPLSGEQKPNRGVAALAQLLTLPAGVRVADELLTPGDQKPTEAALPVAGPLFGSTERQKALDKLFSKLEQRRSPARVARSLVAPAIPRDTKLERDLNRLRSILEALEANGSDRRRELGEHAEEEAAGAPESRHRQIERRVSKEATEMKRRQDRAQRSLDKMFAAYDIKADPWTGDVYGIGAYGSKPQTGPPAGYLGGKRVRGATSATSSPPEAGTLGGRPARGNLTQRGIRRAGDTEPGRLPPAGTLGGVEVR